MGPKTFREAALDAVALGRLLLLFVLRVLPVRPPPGACLQAAGVRVALAGLRHLGGPVQVWPQRALQARGLDVLKRALPLVLGCFGVPLQELLVLRREDPVLRLLRRHEVLEGRACPPPAPALQLKDLLFRAARRPLDPEHRRVDPEAVLRLLERAHVNLEGPQRLHGVRSQAPQGVRDVIPLRHGLALPAALGGLLGDVRLCHAPCVHWQQRAGLQRVALAADAPGA